MEPETIGAGVEILPKFLSRWIAGLVAFDDLGVEEPAVALAQGQEIAWEGKMFCKPTRFVA